MSVKRIDEYTDQAAPFPADALVLLEINPANPATRDYRKGTLADLVARAGLVSASGLTMPTARMLGRTTAATGAVEDLTAANVKDFLSLTNLGAPLFARGTGTAYVLTASQAAVVFGTTSPSIILNQAGTWAIFPTIQIQTQAATFAASRTATVNLRRTNNTPANIGQSGFAIVPAMTTLTSSVYVTMQPIEYVTVNNDDQLTLFADISALPSAGTIEAVRGSILAVLIRPAGF